MKIFTKKLTRCEVRYRCVLIPRDKIHLFPEPGIEFDLTEGKDSYRIKIDRQYRLRLAKWFRQHQNVKHGDEVTFSMENGNILITLLKNFTVPDKPAVDWALEVISAIRDGDVFGVLTLSKNGYKVEVGHHIKETQVIFENSDNCK